MAQKIPVWITSLGCPKNRVDTEQLLGSLGCQISITPHLGRARIAFINTCAFIEPACRESLRAIFDAADHIKRLRRKPLLVVAGCLPGRYGTDTLAAQIPEVDLWLDSASIEKWPEMLSAAIQADAPAAGRRLSYARSYAWLKISDGCQRKCAFCTIPAIRGPLKSVPAQALLEEGAALMADGASELVLVGQDVTAWGRDFLARPLPAEIRPARDLPGLIRQLRELQGLRWLRLMYLYPDSISDELLKVMSEGAPVLPYLDIPFQHCQKEILKRMARPCRAAPLEIVEKVRAFLPQAALRCTLMTGYPGETEQDFQALCDFVKKVRFHNLGVFPFMAEEGTRAASLPDQIPESVRQERADEIMALQAGISAEILENHSEQKMEVLVDSSKEEEWPGLHAGRVWFQAPEVDGLTYISGENVAPGQMISATIASASTYDLSALA